MVSSIADALGTALKHLAEIMTHTRQRSGRQSSILHMIFRPILKRSRLHSPHWNRGCPRLTTLLPPSLIRTSPLHLCRSSHSSLQGSPRRRMLSNLSPSRNTHHFRGWRILHHFRGWLMPHLPRRSSRHQQFRGCRSRNQRSPRQPQRNGIQHSGDQPVKNTSGLTVQIKSYKLAPTGQHGLVNPAILRSIVTVCHSFSRVIQQTLR
jgi:hypothetical protein